MIPYESESTYTQKPELVRDCIMLMPRNPYNQGSGHYAGYEWGESGKTCRGNSSSFIEGCEEYQLQEDNYNRCL